MGFKTKKQKVMDTLEQARRDGKSYYKSPVSYHDPDAHRLGTLVMAYISSHSRTFSVEETFPCRYVNIEWKIIPESQCNAGSE